MRAYKAYGKQKYTRGKPGNKGKPLFQYCRFSVLYEPVGKGEKLTERKISVRGEIISCKEKKSVEPYKIITPVSKKRRRSKQNYQEGVIGKAAPFKTDIKKKQSRKKRQKTEEEKKKLSQIKVKIKSNKRQCILRSEIIKDLLTRTVKALSLAEIKAVGTAFKGAKQKKNKQHYTSPLKSLYAENY